MMNTAQQNELAMAIADCPPSVQQEIARLRHALAAQWGGRAYSFDLEVAENQRDQLLDVIERAVRRLEIAHTNGDSIMREWIIDARAAIASVKGGA